MDLYSPSPTNLSRWSLQYPLHLFSSATLEDFSDTSESCRALVPSDLVALIPSENIDHYHRDFGALGDSAHAALKSLVHFGAADKAHRRTERNLSHAVAIRKSAEHFLTARREYWSSGT